MSTKSASLSIVRIQLGLRKLSVIRSSGVSAVHGLLTELSVILWVSAVEECPVHCNPSTFNLLPLA